MTINIGNPGTQITTAQIDTLLSDLGTASRDLTTKLNSLTWVNLGTAGVPIYELQANVIPRTDFKANLTGLSSGGGELTSATDVAAIVQLNGSSGSGTTAVYSPMAPGVWTDSTNTLSAAGLNLTTPSGTTAVSNSINIYANGTSLPGAVYISGSLYSAAMEYGIGVSISGGASTTIGPSVSIAGGRSVGTGGSRSAGGTVSIYGGTGTATTAAKAIGGSVSISGGVSTTWNGGSVSIAAADSSQSGSLAIAGSAGGSVSISAGSGRNTAGSSGGSVSIYAGTTALDGNLSPVGNYGTIKLYDGPDTASPNVLLQISSPTARNTIGFFGVAPVTKPIVSGSIASGTALTSLLTALASLGLITNNTIA